MTKYQVALMRGNDVLFIYGYTERKSKQGIIALMSKDVTHLLTDDEMDVVPVYTKKDGLKLGGKVKVCFTGFTEKNPK